MSQVNADTLANRLGTGPTNFVKQWAAKAFVAFNGTGTIAITASKNISSVTDGGVGAYVPNFTSVMATAAYNVSTALQNTGGGSAIVAVIFGPSGGKSASGVGLQCVTLAAALADNTDVNVNVYGDLA